MQQNDLHLQRRVGQQAQQLGLGLFLGGHDIEDRDAKRTDILFLSPLGSHDEYAFA